MEIWLKQYFTGNTFSLVYHCCAYHDDAGTDAKPAGSPPQPEGAALFSQHHLEVFDQTVPPYTTRARHSLTPGLSVTFKHRPLIVIVVVIFTIYVAKTKDLQEHQEQHHPAGSKLVD